jgi:hypothetical protein
MSLPDPGREDSGRTTWVHIEVSLDIDGVLHEYTIEGRPDGGPLHIELDPEYSGEPIATLHTLGLNLVLRLDNPTLHIRSDDSGNGDSPPRLRAV